MTNIHTLPALPELAVGQELAPRTVVAHNTSTSSDNKIHDDEVARKYGFSGGLVPGVTVYAYMAGALVSSLGERWLAAGEATVTFISPLYEGEQATCRALVSAVEPEAAGERITIDFWA